MPPFKIMSFMKTTQKHMLYPCCMLLTKAQMTRGWKHSYTPALCMLVNQNHSLHTPHFSIQGNMHAKRLMYTSMFSLCSLGVHTHRCLACRHWTTSLPLSRRAALPHLQGNWRTRWSCCKTEACTIIIFNNLYLFNCPIIMIYSILKCHKPHNAQN